MSSTWKIRQAVATVLASLTATQALPPLALGAQLPVPCAPGTCGAANPGFVTSGAATTSQAGNALTVNQQTAKAILNWSSFNIGAGNKVQFEQPSASAIALNNIYQQNPSSIFGQLTANGQIYLVNANGFLFGPTARVNASGVIASSLGISQTTFNNGLLEALQTETPALAGDGRTYVEDDAGNPVLGPNGQPQPVQVAVEQGAQISTSGGRILLAGQIVQNSGTLSAPDGQVVLAAGQEVYLQASSDPNLRGLIVEVDGNGQVWNQSSGVLSADRGNISLVALAINQNGRISAGTSVTANGSVRLEAANSVAFSVTGTEVSVAAQQGGTLTLGPQSLIELQPEYSSSAKAPDADSQPQSQITMTGQSILFEGGSIQAPDGVLQVTASTNPSVPLGSYGTTDARIRIHSGTSIDLAGSDAELPMSANLLAVQLRANELADDPTQRNGALRGQTVYIDTRVGTPLMGSSALAEDEGAIENGVAYRTENGGSASFESDGDIVLQQGATINVSGGQTTYQGGIIQTSELIGANGQLYNVGTANPLLTYVGVLNPTFTQSYNKWGVQTIVDTPGLSHYESGYVQGASAGSITFAAPDMALSGTLLGTAVNGAEQRSGSSVAAGGTLTIGIPSGTYSSTQNGGYPDFWTPPISFTAQPVPISISDNAALPTSLLQLPASWFNKGGFTDIQIYGDTSVTLPAGVPLHLTPGATLAIDAPSIEVDSDITASGGSLQLDSVMSADAADPNVGRTGVRLGNDVALDVSGQWTNDAYDMDASEGIGPTLQNGGKISLALQVPYGALPEGSALILGDDVTLRANGGAWVSSTGAISDGSGGSISLLANPAGAALELGSDVDLAAFGVNGSTGGSFALSAPRIAISSGGTWSGAQVVDDTLQPGGVLNIGAALFSDYGFSSVTLNGTGPVEPGASSQDILTVKAGTTIVAQTRSLVLNSGYLEEPTGSAITTFSEPTLLPEYQRPPVSVTLEALPQSVFDTQFLEAGTVDVQAGSTISTDPNGNITLASLGSIYVDGRLSAPGGSINLHIESPPYYLIDPGFVPTLGLTLGPQAVLDAAGALVSTPNDLGLSLGTVLPGGSVNLFADRGTVVADAGSLIDVAGASAVLDIPTDDTSSGYIQYTVGSAGGALSVHSPLAVSLLGTLRAAAGRGDYGAPAAGSIELQLTQAFGQQSWFSPPGGAYGPDALSIQLVSSTSGTAASQPDSGRAVLGVEQLEASGADSLQLVAESGIEFSSSIPLDFARQVILDAPVINVDNGTQAAVAANYVQLGDSSPHAPSATGLVSGTGTFSAQAQQIDLLGSFGFSGAQAVSLTSAGDIQLRGDATGEGELMLAGNLTLNAARIYPATLTPYTIDALNPGNRVQIGQTSASPGTPLSAGGSITIEADVIDSAGTLMAPFGTINLIAGTTLDLEPHSVTSVSAAGTTVLFGSTEFNGAEWTYQPNLEDGLEEVITGIPQRAVTLQAPNVSISSGATVDLRGGGDLMAYEWVPGTGGTTDALAAGTTPGLYAIIPSLVNQYAPYDPQESAGAGIAAGASIYLSGGGGIPAGTYPLLPARYALLPGAYLVSVESGYSGIVPGHPTALADGTPVVAGYLTFGDTGLHSAGFSNSGYQGVAIWPGSYGQELATYNLTYASTFFAAAAANAGLPAPNLPADAGQLSIAVDASLNVAGNVLTSPLNSSGRAAEVDISATDLEITDGTTPVPEGTVGVTASVVSSWKVGELYLGGHPSADGSSIEVEADTVTLGPGAALSANQIIVVAGQSIDLESGSSLLSTSALPGASAPSQLPAASFLTLTGVSAANAAMLAVSDLELPLLERSGGAVNPASVSVAAGATVGSRGAISIDALGSVSLAGNVRGAGASWSLAASSIGFVGDGTSSDALQIDSATQAAMEAAGALQLSAGTINLYTPLQFGGHAADGAATLDSLTLAAATLNLNAAAAAGTSTFAARNIVLEGEFPNPSVVSQNSSPSESALPPAAPPSAGNGTLNFNASQVDLGNGTIELNGAAQTQINASSALVAVGFGNLTSTASSAAPATNAGGGALMSSGNLSIVTPLITTVSGAYGELDAVGTLSISGARANVAPVTSLGGQFDFNANAISVSNSAITVPAGIVQMQSANDIDLAAGAAVNVSGIDVAINQVTVGAEGGRILLNAGGDLNLASGSSLSVSGAGDAPAGTIDLTATGNADLAATLAGKPGTGAQSGQFLLDAGSLTQSLTSLSGVLQSGGFQQQINILTHSGNLVLAPGAQLTATEVTLTADGGVVDIGGTISAPDFGVRGEIGLFGQTGTILESTGQLYANTAGGEGIGGNIELGTGASGSVTLDPGSVVSATGAAADGMLLIRAPVNAAGTDINLNAAGSDWSQLGQIVLEPVITETLTYAPAATDFANIQADVATVMSSVAANVAARLTPGTTGGPLGSQPVQVRPAVDLDLVQSGTLTLMVAPDFASWQFDGQPVDLTIRSTGSLIVDTGPLAVGGGSFTDGFVSIPTSRGSQTVGLASGDYESASIRLVAGADTNSPNPLATVEGSAADLTIAPGTTVATGTGEIDLVASGNITFGAGAEVFTAGQNGAAAFSPNLSSLAFNFPTGGGNLLVAAGGDIVGALTQPTPSGGPSITSWQIREGNATTPAQWGVDLGQYGEYGWNLATLGGGDLSVVAGGSITTLTAAAADSYGYASGAATPTHFLSGGLEVSAGGDIGSSEFYEADGVSLLSAGGAFSAVQPNLAVPTETVGSLIALGDAQVSVEARLGVILDAIVNPTAMNQPNSLATVSRHANFFTYTGESALTVQSSFGDVALRDGSVYTLVGPPATGPGGNNQQYYPATLIARSLSGDLLLTAATLFPSDNGQLELVAAVDIPYSTLTPLMMSDAFASNIPTPQAPGAGGGRVENIVVPFASAGHLDDSVPAVVSAGRDIDDLVLSVPEATQIFAGRDITDLEFAGQNLNADDITLISAGRDFTDSLDATGTEAYVQVGGPGQLDVLAGRNLDLGFSDGIWTTGNTVNPNLSTSVGADVTVMAGLGQSPDYAAFLQKIVATNPEYQAQLIAFVESVDDPPDLSFAQAEAEFMSFSPQQRAGFLDQVFFEQLGTSGTDDNTIPGAGFTLGYAAIDTLFPNSRAASATGASHYSGDLDLTFSRVYTLSGGSISLLAPGGAINVGLANPPPGVPQRPPSELGIVAQEAGDVNIYSQGDVLVNSSRIFTLGGGNILIWSDEGNIDAGRGAKAAISAPPPQIGYNADGDAYVVFSGAAAGSGIRTIQVEPDVPPGNVNLVAPEGTVNAGDAGIGAAGNINIAAQHVLGLDNIQFGGTATGVPAQVSDIGATLSGATSVASSSTNTATSSAEDQVNKAAAASPLAQAAISWLDVFVTGLGEENCRPDDAECLKRQKRQ